MAYNTDTGGQTIYDVIVDSAGGGDYTSIAAALTAAGENKSIFVYPGTYTEGANIEPKEGQTLVGYGVDINFDAGYWLRVQSTEPNVSIIGTWHITGDGVDNNHRLLFWQGNYGLIDGVIRITSTKATATVGQLFYVAQLSGNYCHLDKIIMDDIAVATNEGTYSYGFVLSGDYNYLNIVMGNFTVTNTQAQTQIGLVLLNNGVHTTGNIVNAIVGAVTTSNGNTGYGIWCEGSTTYNSVSGSSRGSDGANLTDSGTGNKTGSVAV